MDKKNILSYIHTNLTPEESLYIRMCADADEILQKWWKPKIGDMCIDMGDKWRIWNLKTLEYLNEVKEDDIWLPSQEDFQGMMIAPTMENTTDFVVRFANWCEGHRDYKDPYRKFSMRCLWLCYFMHHLYHKEWTGERFE